MSKEYNQLIDEILSDYHEKIHETVPFADLGSFLSDLLFKYKELHPYQKPSLTEIDGVQVFDIGDLDLYANTDE